MVVDEAQAVLQVSTFFAWTAGVAATTWYICRNFIRKSENASDDHFAGGRSLRWYVVAGSLMLTNLSTEQLVGLNGATFADGCLAGIWWEAGASVAMLLSATVFLPCYMALGLTTTSGFLGERYSTTLRTLVSVIFLLYYALALCPLVLYTGALAIQTIFELHWVPLWALVLVIGLLGAAYALAGGLRAVAVSDCLNGVGLIAIGLWVPLAALQMLPDGISTLFSEPQLLKPLVRTSHILDRDSMTRSRGVPSVPWDVTITGMLLNNLYYWSANQVIVQRVLAAESLAHGQKGVLFAALMKVVGFSFLCLPGVVAILLAQHEVVVDGRVFKVERADEVYPELVRAVMPTWSLGFFAAVLIGSVLSTFNSALNSASTMFGLEMYKVFLNPEASDEHVVKISNAFGACLTAFSFVIAPQLQHADSIFGFLQRVNTLVSLPIVTIFFVGTAASLPDAFAAKVGFAVAALAGCLGQLAPGLHYLHRYFIGFILATASMALVTYVPCIRRALRLAATPAPYASLDDASLVNMRPWRFLYATVGAIAGLLVLLVAALQAGSFWMMFTFWVSWAVAILAMMALSAKAPPEAANTSAPRTLQGDPWQEGAVWGDQGVPSWALGASPGSYAHHLQCSSPTGEAAGEVAVPAPAKQLELTLASPVADAGAAPRADVVGARALHGL